jgi:hypothetical protein
MLVDMLVDMTAQSYAQQRPRCSPYSYVTMSAALRRSLFGVPFKS